MWKLSGKFHFSFGFAHVSEVRHIDVIEDSPFFVRPFPIVEKDKPIMDRQMNLLVSLGILSPNNTSHTSPIMLITCKVTQDKHPVVDFHLLNTHQTSEYCKPANA